MVLIIGADEEDELSGWGLAGMIRDRLCLLNGDSSSFLFLQPEIKPNV